MVKWTDNYRQAKFRNVEFYVSQSEYSGGRRVQVKELPGKDNPIGIDLGRKKRGFPVEAYIFGDNYFYQKNRLIKALEKGGNGTLIHPYYGEKKVVLLDFNVRESSSETRMCRITIKFVEMDLTDLIKIKSFTQSDILSARERALLALQSMFLKLYSIANQPFDVLDNLQETISIASVAVDGSKKLLNAVPEFNTRVRYLQDNIATLIGAPAELFRATIDLLSFGTLITDSFPVTKENAIIQFNNLRDLYSFKPENAVSENDPSNIYAKIISIGSIIVSGGLTASIVYSSINSAEAVQSALFTAINNNLLDPFLDTELFNSLRDLKSSVSLDLQNRGQDLPRLIEVELPQAIPALVLSFALYNNIEAETTIINQNSIQHPGFVPKNTPIKVVSGVK